MTKTNAEMRDRKKLFWLADLKNITTTMSYKV